MEDIYVFVFSLLCQIYSSSQSGTSVATGPYMLVADVHGILHVSMDGNGSYHYLVRDYGISAIDYHYERGLLFWVNQRFPALKFTNLTNGTEIFEVYAPRMDSPSGIAVDWLNDRVYWIERGNRIIRVYDLNTRIISTVINLPHSTLSMKLKILPHIGLLFWGDRNKQGIVSSSISQTINQREIIADVHCPESVAVDYKTGNVYAMDACTGAFKACRIDGSHKNTISNSIAVGLISGLCMHDEKLFWTVQKETANVNYVVMETVSSYEYFRMRYDSFSDVTVVHPSNQPSELELRQYGLCDLMCHHGNCTWDGRCVCHDGWSGLDCGTDINECENGNGGCEEECENLPGTFLCNCTNGKELSSDEKTCMFVEQTTSSLTHTANDLNSTASSLQTTSIGSNETTLSNSSEDSIARATDVLNERHRGDSYRHHYGNRVPVNRIRTQATYSVETSANNWGTTDSGKYSSEEEEPQETDGAMFLFNLKGVTVKGEKNQNSTIAAVLGSTVILTIILIFLLFATFLYVKSKCQRSNFYNIYHFKMARKGGDNEGLPLDQQLENESKLARTGDAQSGDIPLPQDMTMSEGRQTQTTSEVEACYRAAGQLL